ncbi:MAG: glycosyltransferase family 9 protein [Oligoflexia bacterium]|nr:glycosyltransferase family 9 protein [Oligoflexia bacterium]
MSKAGTEFTREQKSPDASDPLRILVVRADRMGDVILSTPVFEVIKRHYPKCHLAVMVREMVAPLIRGLPAVDEVIVYDPDRLHSGIRGIWRLIRELRSRQFKVAIILQSQWRIGLAAFLARIRFRVGPLGKLHSYFFYNRGVRQRRSQVEMHEADYNLQLLRKLGIRVGTRKVPVRVNCSPQSVEEARAWLLSQGWKPGKPLVVVHPGMAGSALNWPEANYIELIRALHRTDHQVLVSGGAAETSLLSRIRETLGKALAEKTIFYNGTVNSVEFLAGIYSHANLVVAPSTGTLHLAVALGKPVLTFYPPVRVQSVIRWGPYCVDEDQASILVPDVYCGQDFKCIGNLCNYFPCMRSLTVNQAIEQVKRQLDSQMQPKLGD